MRIKLTKSRKPWSIRRQNALEHRIRTSPRLTCTLWPNDYLRAKTQTYTKALWSSKSLWSGWNSYYDRILSQLHLFWHVYTTNCPSIVIFWECHPRCNRWNLWICRFPCGSRTIWRIWWSRTSSVGRSCSTQRSDLLRCTVSLSENMRSDACDLT